MSWILKSLTQLLFEAIASGLDMVASWVQNFVSFNRSAFISLFSNSSSDTYFFNSFYQKVVIPLAIALIVFNLIMGFFKGFFSENVVDVEEPGPLLIRSIIAIFIVREAQLIIAIFVAIFNVIVDSLDLTVSSVSFSSFGKSVSGFAEASDYFDSVGDQIEGFASLVIGIIFMCIIAWNYFKIVFTLIQRYVLYNMLVIFAPLGFSCFSSRNTVDIAKRYAKLFAESLLSLLFSLCFMKAYVNGITYVMSAQINVMFMNFLLLLAFAKLVLNLDDLLVQAGLLAVRPMPSHFPMPMILGTSRGIGKIISHSGGKIAASSSTGAASERMPKPGNGAAAENGAKAVAASEKSDKKVSADAAGKSLDFETAKRMINGNKNLKNEAAEDAVRTMMPSGGFMQNGKSIGGLNGKNQSAGIPMNNANLGINDRNLKNQTAANEIGSMMSPKGLGQNGKAVGELSGISPCVTMIGANPDANGRIKTAGMYFDNGGNWSDPTNGYVLGEDKMMDDFMGGSILDSSNIQSAGLNDLSAFNEALSTTAGTDGDGIVEGYSSDGIPMTFMDNGSGGWAVDIGDTSYPSLDSAIDAGALSQNDTVNLYNPASATAIPSSMDASEIRQAFNDTANISYNNGFPVDSDFSDMKDYTITRAGNSTFEGNYIGKDGLSRNFTGRYVTEVHGDDIRNSVKLRDGNYFRFESTGVHKAVAHIDDSGSPIG